MKKTLEKLRLINASGCEIQVYSRLVLFLKKKINIVLDNRFLWPILFCCGHAGGECNRIPQEEN